MTVGHAGHAPRLTGVSAPYRFSCSPNPVISSDLNAVVAPLGTLSNTASLSSVTSVPTPANNSGSRPAIVCWRPESDSAVIASEQCRSLWSSDAGFPALHNRLARTLLGGEGLLRNR